jgi:hypothetical protein
MRSQQRQKDEFGLGLVCPLNGLLEEDRLNRLMHRPGVIQGPAHFVLHRSHDLTVELPDDVSDVAASSVEPGQVDQNRSDRNCQQHEAGQRRSKPELASCSSPRGRRNGVPGQSEPDSGLSLGEDTAHAQWVVAPPPSRVAGVPSQSAAQGRSIRACGVTHTTTRSVVARSGPLALSIGGTVVQLIFDVPPRDDFAHALRGRQ